MKVVYNACFGGFSLSGQAIKRYIELGGELANVEQESNISRSDTKLIQVVEELGEDANGDFAFLQIAEVPRGAHYRIDNYDGSERVMTVEDYKRETAT